MRTDQQHQLAPVVRLGISDLEARLGVDRSTIWRWYRAGSFPPPHYLGERRVWFVREIEAWEQQRIARPPESRRTRRNADRLRRRADTGKGDDTSAAVFDQAAVGAAE